MEKLFESTFSTLKGKCGIYYLKLGERAYVGSSIDLHERLGCHKSSLKHNKHHSKFIQSVFNKLTLDECFVSILEECAHDVRLEREKYWIDKLSPEFNFIKDPTTRQNCVTTSKVVYQYTLSGNYLAEFESAQEAGRILKLNGNTITKCCTGNHAHKSHGRSLWSYEKYDKLPEYQNNSAKAKIKAVTMYDKEGNKLKRFDSIAQAAREIEETSEEFSSLCASISSVAGGKGNFVKNKYMFSYKDQEQLLRTLSRGYPVICVESDGTEIVYQNAEEAASAVKGKASGIHKVLRGERSRYRGFIWKIGSGFKTP